MQQFSAFSAAGSFFRGNLHTHSTRSDGVLSPEEVCRRYRAQGYDFISLTDHFVGFFKYPITDTVPFRTSHFTTVLGAELHSGKMENGELWHLLAVGLPADFEPSNSPGFEPLEEQETGPELAARAVAAGAFVAIAHPQWSGLTVDDARSITSAHAVEVYNHGCAMGCDRPDGFSVLDQLLAGGRQVNLIATDDAHFNEPDHFGGWVMVKAGANEPGALLAALKNGDYYSSQGPQFLNISMTKTEIHVEMTACVSVIVSGAGTAAKAVHGHSLTKATVSLARFKNSPFIRVTVIDAAGNRAWSNPHYL